MFYKKEKNLIYIIRYAPLLLILILSIFTTYFVDQANKKQYLQEIERTSDIYTKLNNEKLKEEVTKLYNYIEKEDTKSKEKLKKQIKMRVYEAHAIATKIYNDNKDSKTKQEIFELVKSALGSIIYNNGRGYFFIDNVKGVKLLQPLNKKIENKNFSQLEDVKGYKFIQTIIQTVKDKTERYDTYYWYKNAKDSNAYKKMSFYKYFEPFDVIIGTGEYIDDFELEIKNDVINFIKNYNINNDNYIFMFDFNGIMLAHKNEQLLGGNYLKDKGAVSRNIINDFIDIGKNKEQYISYFNPSVKDEPYEKTSYVKGYPKWEWVFGTGYNNEKLVKMIEKVKIELEEKNRQNFINILIVSVVVTITLLILSVILSKYLENIFSSYKKRIRDEEREFRNLFEYSNIGLALCDSEGRFINVNKKLVQILGYKNKKELLNKRWFSVNKENSINKEDENFLDLITQRINTYSLEKTYKKEDGSRVDTFITANMLKEKSGVKNILFSIIDVTDVKTKDRLLSQQSKMASMGEMIANIAHQWRQPLSLISTASSGMKIQKEYDLLTDKYFYSSVESITNATEYLSETINDFKNFFTPKSEKELFNMPKLMEKTKVLLSAELKNKQIKIIEDIAPIDVLSYENDLIQVFINIINNAKDALKESKEGYIFIDVKPSKNDKDIIIKIKDNGGGIQEDVISKVFEPYFTTKYKSNGTGIGLYMVMEIVQKHMNGTIDVQNTKYEYNDVVYTGAEFTIRIPFIK